MQNSSAFQYLTVDTIHESTTNPRRTFEESKLQELAESIRQHGLIQPITVRPNNQGFEIVAGARRFRAAQLAELFAVPARIVEIDDAQALEWQLVENSQRVDVHPYEEAQGFERLLNMPGYDVAALVEKSGKSASHIYARLSLLQLIPHVAESFTQERITASHANLIARLPQESQSLAFEQCWRKDWQDKEPHLLPAKQLTAWIQANLHLALADAPFDREDLALNPAAGACVTCPRRSGYNTSLFCDVQGDQCLDSSCYQAKVVAHIDREIAAHPDLVQIENGYRDRREQKPGVVPRGHFHEIEVAQDNPDVEPGPSCIAIKPAIIVYGRRIGTTLTVCTDEHCPVHALRAAIQQAAPPTYSMSTISEVQTEAEAEQRQQQYEQQQQAYRQEEERRAEEQKQENERREKEWETERAQMKKLMESRTSTFDRILAHAPAMFTAPQLKVFLRALVSLDPYTFADDLAEHFAGDGDYPHQTAESILLEIIDGLPDAKLTGLALRLALTGHTGIPRESEIDFLTEAEAAFAPATSENRSRKNTKHPLSPTPHTNRK